MNLIRCTIVDRQGVVSFVAHGDALPALAVACAAGPTDLGELLLLSEPYYFDGSGYTETVFSYRLPKEWALVA